MATSTLVLIAVAVLAGLWLVVTYNRLVSGRNAVDNAFKQIDIQLKRRLDLIPNLVESVRGFMRHESETLEKVIRARNAAMSAATVEETFAANAVLGQATHRLFGLAEAYPDLKAQAGFSRLMEELAGTENKIAFARQHYNDSATSQNDRVQHFPANLVANAFGFRPAPLWELDEAEKAAAQAAPAVSF
ncbi:LemA family protein [Novispirillum sp. DQ9]|uniref:LemA family protein n=1 Tax=Novispirillum sp. DQ9 TaxID=3398612 RepID=UPI003C7B0376